MFKSLSATLTAHCYEEHIDRLKQIDEEIGFGEIICTTLYRGRRNCLTTTGILLIMDATRNILITAYPARWKIALKMFYEVFGCEPDENYSKVINRVKDWDRQHNWF